MSKIIDAIVVYLGEHSHPISASSVRKHSDGIEAAVRDAMAGEEPTELSWECSECRERPCVVPMGSKLCSPRPDRCMYEDGCEPMWTEEAPKQPTDVRRDCLGPDKEPEPEEKKVETKEQWCRCEQCPRRRCEHLGANSFPPMCKPSTFNPIWEALETTPPPELSDEEKERLRILLREAFLIGSSKWGDCDEGNKAYYRNAAEALYRDFYAKYQQRTDSRRLSDALAKLPSEYYISLYRSGSGELIDGDTIDGDAVENATEWGPTDNSVTAIEKAIEECKPEPTEEENTATVLVWAFSEMAEAGEDGVDEGVWAAWQAMRRQEARKK